MTENESKLRELVISDNASEAIDSAVTLYTAYLSVRGELEEAEFFLLSVIGLQSISHGFIVELSLGEIYLDMKEQLLLLILIQFFQMVNLILKF